MAYLWHRTAPQIASVLQHPGLEKANKQEVWLSLCMCVEDSMLRAVFDRGDTFKLTLLASVGPLPNDD